MPGRGLWGAPVPIAPLVLSVVGSPARAQNAKPTPIKSVAAIPIYPGAKTKTVFAARPTFERPDSWICFATFMWLVKEENGDVTGMMVSVRDAGTVRSKGISKSPQSYSPRTRNVIKRTTWVDPVKVPSKFGQRPPMAFYCF